MTGASILCVCVLDVLLGDPRWLPHPVRGMGRLIAIADRGRLARPMGPSTERWLGVALAVGLPVLVYGAAATLIAVAARVAAPLAVAVEMLLGMTALAARDLAEHALSVRHALQMRNVEEARAAVGRIVGRDTAALSEPEVVRASVETVAESACDGVLAPLLYLVIGGAPLALAYKAMNTMDSMIGHVEPPYRDFGWAAARLDDAANWIPARITAVFIAVAAPLALWRAPAGPDAFRTWMRDGAKHPSPNSGRPEAAMAGALGVQLGGTNHYGGVAVERPVIGQAGGRRLGGDVITDAVRIMWLAYALAVIMVFHAGV